MLDTIMHLPAIGALVFLAIVTLGLLIRKMGVGAGTGGVYYLRKSLFTPAERSFFGVLESLAIPDVTITSKVRLADIFGIVKGLNRGERQRSQNKINAKHVDFVLLQKSDGKPILGIELDDSSHQVEKRINRDNFVDAVFASARLPILHVEVRAGYNAPELRERINSALGNRV
jgi:Protein of unknown function (DUF2726)